MTARMTVRPATFEDIPWMFQQLRSLDEFLGLQHSYFPAPAILAQKVDMLIANHPAFVAETDYQEQAGFIMGILAEHLLNPARMTLTEIAWWVSPEHRGSPAASLLLDAFMDCGKRHADAAVLVLPRSLNPRSFTKRGLSVRETTYMIEYERSAA